MNKFMKRMANKQRKGFTLVELVVVILIIAILAAAIFLGGATVIKQARERQVMNDLRNFGTYVQDMLYENPSLQYHENYAVGEHYTYDATTKTFSGVDNDGAALTAGTDGRAVIKVDTMTVFTLLDEYLTDDFKLGNVVDAWDNPYLFSYHQIAAQDTGDTSSCIVVISSLGTNSLDETSDGCGVEAQCVAFQFDKQMDTSGVGKGDKFDSAEAYLNDYVLDALEDAETDDYGVVIVMIDGQVSVGYYGF